MKDLLARITEAELEILKVIWGSDQPLTEKDIIEALMAQNDWKRSTIQTLVRRLVDKSVLQRDKPDEREMYCYTPMVSQKEYAEYRASDVLHQVFGGNVQSMVTTLLNNEAVSDEDMNALERFWRERRKNNE